MSYWHDVANIVLGSFAAAAVSFLAIAWALGH
jgi:hypothetical protein